MSINWEAKWQAFVRAFVDNNGHERVTEGLLNTVEIAVIGLAIGIVIGTLIAVVKTMPKYKIVPRILDQISTVYVGFFRGTPIVVSITVGVLCFIASYGNQNTKFGGMYCHIRNE